MHPIAKTLGILSCKEKVLVEELYGKHSIGEGTFYRPIGGTIEFGEKSADAIIREYNEELNVAIIIKNYIGCVENIFKIGEDIGHEIIQLYSVSFKDKVNYTRDQFKVVEGSKMAFAKWISVDDFINGRKTLYPNGIISELERGIR